jgi:Brp/Blh family beta-carotene 15,15'-monooxygenase
MEARLPAVPPPETWAFLGLGAVAVAWPAIGVTPAGAVIADSLVFVLAIAVAIVGLPHGALDPWIARRAGLWKTARGCAVFHLGYVSLAVMVLLAWRAAPGAALAGFLSLSAWHFGGDWRTDLPVWARVSAGAALLALPAWRWHGEVEQSFGLLAGQDGRRIADALAVVGPGVVAAMAAVVMVAARRSITSAIELLAVAALAVLLSPLVYFIVYFCALHSLRHLRLAAASALPGARTRMAGIVALYTALTLAAATLIWPWLAGFSGHAADWSDDLLRLVFIGLAALTLPHMLVVVHAERRAGANHERDVQAQVRPN